MANEFLATFPTFNLGAGRLPDTYVQLGLVHLKWKQIPIGQKEIIIQINSIFFLNMTLSTWTKIEPKFNVQNLSFKISSMPKFIE